MHIGTFFLLISAISHFKRLFCAMWIIAKVVTEKLHKEPKMCLIWFVILIG